MFVVQIRSQYSCVIKRDEGTFGASSCLLVEFKYFLSWFHKLQIDYYLYKMMVLSFDRRRRKLQHLANLGLVGSVNDIDPGGIRN